MPENISNISSAKKQFQTGEMKVPVFFHASGNLLLKEETLNQYQKIAGNRNLFHHISVLSDIHEKKGSRAPAGTITASENYLLPQLIDAAPNCGTRMILTDLSPKKDLIEERADELFKILRTVIPASKYTGTKIPSDAAIEVFRRGSKAIIDHFPIRIKNERENTFKKGDMFEGEKSGNPPTKRDIRNTIPSLFLKMARLRLGILGATGSHFLYLLKVREIFNAEMAEKFGLSQGQYVFFMHTGSGIIGRCISSIYTPCQKVKFLNKIIINAGQSFFNSQMKKVFQHLRKRIKLAEEEEELFSYDDQSIEGRMFVTAHQAAGNFGFANRTVISHNLDLALEKIFRRPVGLNLLYDTPHVYISRENHFGKNVWIHRNGAVRALGPLGMKDHAVFGQTGEPVFVAPMENTLAYLGTGTDENEAAFFSANHEIGKVGEINLAAIGDSPAIGNKFSFNVYAGKKRSETQNEIYQNYADKIIRELENNRIMKPIASFEPAAKLTY